MKLISRTHRRGLSALLFATSALVMLGASAAHAQTVPPPAAAGPVTQTPGASSQVQEVVVTAERRAENIQQVPIQVTAFSGKTLANASAQTTQDVLNLTPNVSMDHSFTFLNSFVVVRGIAEINNADSPLAIIVDGVPQNNQKEAYLDLTDVSQIEILRGPQGGLYGRNAIGGAMIVTTKEPTNSYQGFLQTDFGNGDAYQATGAVSGPIIDDKLLFRVAADIRGFGGLIDNTYLNEPVDHVNHDDTLQAKLLYKATDWLTFDFRARYNWFKAGAVQDSTVFSRNANDFVAPSSDLLGATSGHVGDYTLKFDAKLPFATLTSITNYTDLIEAYRGDLDFTNPVNNAGGFLGMFGPVGQGQNLGVKDTSQEFRLVSPGNRQFRWVAGVYYIHEDRQLLTRAFLDPTDNRNDFDDPTVRILNRPEVDGNDAAAIYGQADYDLTQNLTITGALRYDHDHRGQINPVDGSYRSATFTSPQPKVTLTYHIDSERLVYATYSTGFRSGGFNAPGVSIPEFKDEKLSNYEGGFKTSFFDRRLIFNGDVYYAIDHDFQFFFVDVATASQIIGNLDAVRIWGVELEAEAHPVAGLNIFGSLGTTNTDIERSTEFPGVNGNYTPKTTPYKVNLGVQYEHNLFGDVGGLARVDYEYRAKKYWQIDNLDVQNPISLLNARIGMTKGRYGVFIWSKNLTNTRYYEDYNPTKFSGGQYPIGWLAEPRTYGVELRASF